MKRILKIGLDFDGVIAYNPFRIARPIIAIIKKYLFGVKKLKFWYPEKHWQQIFWVIIHESSVYPAKGIDLLKDLVKNENIEAHLITARYSFLDDHLFKWLDKYQLRKYFKTVNLNIHDEQPHLFKEKMVRKYGLDVFVEDNWDIVNYLNSKFQNPNSKKKTRIFWIYNLLDRNRVYPHKFPYLEKALEEIIKKFK